MATTARLTAAEVDVEVARARCDCTYKPKPDDCKNCLKSYVAIAKKKDGNPERDSAHANCIIFDPDTLDFEPVLNGQGIAISFRLKDTEKLRVQCDNGKVNGITRATATAEDCLEFPCSWITAIMRYAGAGPQAFSYGMEAVLSSACARKPARRLRAKRLE